MKLLPKSLLIKSIITIPAIILIAVFTTISIEKYGKLFDLFGLLAKERLLNYPFAIFVITPLFFWISAFICRKYSSKAAGNSIEHFQDSLEIAKKSNDFHKLKDLLGLKLIIIKAISSLLCVFGGGALGKEGPSVHMSAGIFAVFANKIKKFLPNIDFTTWIISGSAVGMAVAFHAPISGFTFAAEKMIKMKISNFLNKIYFVLIAVITVIVLLYPYQSIFLKNYVKIGFSEIYYSIVTTIVCAVIAFFFTKINKYFYHKITSIKSKYWHLIPILGGILVAIISFYCGIYSFGGGIYTVDAALNSEVLLSYKEVFGRILNTIISFISGCAGGLIAPAIVIGAGIGSVIHSLLTNISIDLVLLIGITAFLAAILREPLTAVMIVFETGNQHLSHIIPLFLIAITALWTVKIMEVLYKKSLQIIKES
jgi:H+/Cl- antiporter ClcA